MATLEKSQIKEILEAPRNAGAILKAKNQEYRLQFHNLPIFEASEGNKALSDFKAWVKSFMYSDKYSTWLKLFTYPVGTNELTEEIFDELSRVFEAHDRYISVQFASNDHSQKFEEYREELRDEEFIQNEIWELYKSSINGFLVVDLPEIQSTPRPQPYFSSIPLSIVHDVQVNKDGDCEYIIYRVSDKELVCIDETHYTLIIDNDGVFDIQEGKPHGLDYCPATSLSRQIISGSNNLNKLSPITKSLGDLDWYLFFKTSKKYLDLYAPFPIYSIPDSKCNYRDPQSNPCEGGYVSGVISEHEGGGLWSKPCPSCNSGSELAGAGSTIKYKVQQSKEDPDLSGGVVVTPAESVSIEFCSAEIPRLRKEIFMSCTGSTDDSPDNGQSKNEDQVQRGVEGQENVIYKIKKDFEALHRFALETAARLMFPDSFRSCTVDYGNEFYLQDVAMLMDDLKKARDMGMPQYYLAGKRQEISHTANRNNPDDRVREELLSQLEPWPDLSLNQITSFGLHEKYPQKFDVKVNFDNYIKRFESENLNIVEFGENLSTFSKLAIITETLNKYYDEPAPREQKEQDFGV